MPSWNDKDSSSDSEKYAYMHEGELSPGPLIPESTFDPDYNGVETALGIDGQPMRCASHGLVMHRFVAFHGKDTGRRFLGCGKEGGGGCDSVHWVDGEWSPTLSRALLKVWKMYADENESRISGNVEYSSANYKLVLEKRELERRVIQMHKELGNTIPEDDAAKMMRDLEHEKNMRKVAEQQVLTLIEEKKKHELCLVDINMTGDGYKDKIGKFADKHLSQFESTRLMRVLEAERNIRELADDQVIKLRKDNENLELYIAELHKASDEMKKKLKTIGDICAE